MLPYVVEGFPIMMGNLKSIVQDFQNYLIARYYKPGKVKKQFSGIKNLAREQARKPKLLKTTFFSSCNLITQYKSLLPNL